MNQKNCMKMLEQILEYSQFPDQYEKDYANEMKGNVIPTPLPLYRKPKGWSTDPSTMVDPSRDKKVISKAGEGEWVDDEEVDEADWEELSDDDDSWKDKNKKKK